MNESSCPTCGNTYKQIGNHWQQKPSHRPEISNEVHQVIKGLMLGDGTLDRSNTNASLQVTMICKEYLDELHKLFGPLSTSVRISQTAEENAKSMRDTNYRPNAKAENYSDVYLWRSRSHPDLNKYREWYENGSVSFPKRLELTPTILKHWFCSDGHYNNSGAQRYIEIAMASEKRNTEKITRYFSDAGLPEPSNYDINANNDGGYNCSAQFTVNATEEIFKYMGSPLPGFEYKWPKSYR